MQTSSAMLAATSLRAVEETKLTDCHVYLGSHPFRQLGAENPREFIQRLTLCGVTEAWTGLFTTKVVAPKNEAELRANPLGIYITEFQWSREL